jgi:drug/metabolite transporter (DMT)-like permease
MRQYTCLMAQTERPRFLLPMAILTAIIAISTASIFIRFAQSEGMPSIVIAALRLTFATLLLTPIILMKHLDEIKRFTRTEILFGALSGFFLALHFATWISSLEYTSVASSAVFVSTGPLWVALLSPLLLNEKLGRVAILGLLLSLTGGIVVGLSDACSWNDGISCPQLEGFLQGRQIWGNFLALLGAWAVTGYLVIGRKVRAGISLLPYIFLVYGMGAIMLIIFLLALGHSPFEYAPKAYGWAFLLALVPQLIGHSTLNWALKHMPATFVAVSTLGEPVGSAILAVIILNEFPTQVGIWGGVLILAGIALISSRKNQSLEIIDDLA